MQDPRLKSAIKSAISKFLYAEPLNRLRGEFEEIVETNDQIHQAPHFMFMYKGKVYKWAEYIRFVYVPPFLAELLHPRMEKYLEAMKVIADEQPLVLGYVQNVLNTSDDPGDYLKLLPSALHAPLKGLVEDYTTSTLTMTDAEKLIKTHSKSVDLLKQRLVFNMLFKS